MGEISWAPIQNFFYDWPRKFFIAFWVEALIAQPIARFAMKQLHAKQARNDFHSRLIFIRKSIGFFVCIATSIHHKLWKKGASACVSFLHSYSSQHL